MRQIKEQIKKIEREEARLARRKKNLEDKIKREAELDKKLDQLIKSSGFKNARDLVKTLVERYGVRVSSASAGGASGGGRRKRTKMTAELRDTILKQLKSGTSMNSISKSTGISYTVILKVRNGAYDKLK